MTASGLRPGLRTRQQCSEPWALGVRVGLEGDARSVVGDAHAAV
ncbi:hypothetical protein ABZV24_31290 [Streptomyces sp. NPDC005251]